MMHRSVNLDHLRAVGKAPADHIIVVEDVLRRLPDSWMHVSAEPEFSYERDGEPIEPEYIGMSFIFMDEIGGQEYGSKILYTNPLVLKDRKIVDYLVRQMERCFDEVRNRTPPPVDENSGEVNPEESA